MSDALAVGDIIQADGPTVPADLRDKFFIVREVTPAGGATLSWPYTDKACTKLYVPFVADEMTGREWRARCATVLRKEKNANEVMAFKKNLRFAKIVDRDYDR